MRPYCVKPLDNTASPPSRKGQKAPERHAVRRVCPCQSMVFLSTISRWPAVCWAASHGQITAIGDASGAPGLEEFSLINDLMYIELKTGYSDDGPAWIGYVKTSKSKKTIYFNDHAFQKNIGTYSNYIDVENGDEYWISGLKRAESNRHWAGHGKVMIDRRAIREYLSLIGEESLPLNLFEVVDIEDRFPIERVNELSNKKK